MKTVISKNESSVYRQAGFTLVELMVVTLIIGILISFSVAASIGAKKTGRDGRRKADLEQIRSALEMCKADHGTYPNTGSFSFGGQLTCGIAPNIDVYMEEVPVDPSIYSYVYNRIIDEHHYELCAHLETGDAADYCGPPANRCGGNCNYRLTNP